MIVVIAPNPFKGTLTAREAAEAIALGVLDWHPGAEIRCLPLADGGEGTLDALLGTGSGQRRTTIVQGPLGAPVEAVWGLIEGGSVGVVELAQSSGMALIPRSTWDPGLTTTYGFGQLLESARRAGVGRIIAGIGGSITNDGGAGMAQALGVRLLDSHGRDLPRGGLALADLARVDSQGVDPDWRRIDVEVAADVTNPLTGIDGASRVYAPQKGADADLCEALELALMRFREVIGPELADTPGAGAAGGLGAGLMYFLGAKLRGGAALLADVAGLDGALIGADLVITGEGRVDAQSAFGKGPIEVARRAAAAGIPVLLAAGSTGTGWERVLSEGVSEVIVAAPPAAAAEGPAARLRRTVEGALRNR